MSRATKKTGTRECVDLLIVNAEELLTLAGNQESPRRGKEMRELSALRDGAVAVRDGRIAGIGPTKDILKEFKGRYIISAQGKTVLPGFIDPHVHLVFAGSREDEFEMRIQGVSYAEITSSGGGILRTARETRRARVERLIDLGIERLDTMLSYGTTTIEAKSGYGLTTSDELKILEATRRLNQLHTVNVVSTLMGARAIPSEYCSNPDELVNLFLAEMIPKVAERGLAEFCDVLCERGVFSLEQAKRILVKSKAAGMKPKIHADLFSNLGGAEIAADIGAVAAEHLVHSSIEGVKALARKGTIAVLLPAAAFSLMLGHYADARLMIDAGVPIALGTGFDADCWVESQQLVIAMACRFMRMTPAEAITAATINAAFAVNRASEVGTLEVGKRADIVVLNVPNHNFIGYRFGGNLTDKVIKNGRLVVDREKQGEPIFLSKTE